MSRLVVNYLDEKQKKACFLAKTGEGLVLVLIGLEAGEKEVVAELKGEGARVEILGILIGNEGEIDIKTTQHHVAGKTESNLLIKSVLFGEAKLNYRGLIKIDKKAQGANAYQRNDNILMSSGAKVNTKPELEILADEVRCTHGATTGRLDEEQLFYLMSRGLGRNEAVKIMLDGFFSDLLERIPNSGQRQKIAGLIKEELGKPLAKL